MLEIVNSIAKSIRGDIQDDLLVPLVKKLVLEIRHNTNKFSSSWHPYGFLVTKIGQTEDGSLLRLHIWPSKQHTRQDPDWPVHRHPWHMTSRIICGVTTNNVYNTSVVEQNTPFLLYEVKYINDISTMEKTKINVAYQKISQTDYYTGQSYTLDQNQYHSTDVPNNCFTATIVLTSKSSGNIPYVIGKNEGDSNYSFKRRTCESLALCSLLECLYESIRR